MALMHVHHASDMLSMNMDMDVILPEASAGQIGQPTSRARKKLPVLYLLHGMSDDHTIWQRRTSIERYATQAGIAVVMPTTQRGFYTDMQIGFKWFSYLTQELIRLVPRIFPQISKRRSDTYVAGLSMGGYGALKCLLRTPQLYCAGAALSAATDILALYDRRKDDSALVDVFGTREQAKGSFNDLFAAAEELAQAQAERPDIYMWCGTEDFLYEDNLRMRDHLSRLGYSLTYTESKGDHSWQYWDEQIQLVLDWMLAGRKR